GRRRLRTAAPDLAGGLSLALSRPLTGPVLPLVAAEPLSSAAAGGDATAGWPGCPARSRVSARSASTAARMRWRSSSERADAGADRAGLSLAAPLTRWGSSSSRFLSAMRSNPPERYAKRDADRTGIAEHRISSPFKPDCEM